MLIAPPDVADASILIQVDEFLSEQEVTYSPAVTGSTPLPPPHPPFPYAYSRGEEPPE